MTRLAIVTTHPIQYNAPWFRLLQEGGRVEPKVFYTWGQLESDPKYDPGFGKTVQWDIPLLEGYQYCFVENISKDPGSHHRDGIVNPSLNNEIAQWRPDAVLVFGWNFVSHFECIKYFHKKIPVIFRGDSTLLRRQSLVKSLARTLYLKWVYHFIDYALYVGTANKNYFLKYGLKESQLIFAPHAIDNDRFADTNHRYQLEADEWKRRIGISTGNLTILYAGKLEEIKHPAMIIELASRLIEQPVNFIIAGNGSLEKELRKMAAGNTKIYFIDFQNQQKMPVLYRLADLFILSSESETWGLGVNEAMACGRGVIVRNTCGCAIDLVQNGENGFVFDASDTDWLYHQIVSLINDRPKCQEMGALSKKIIAPYSFNIIVGAIEGFFEGHHKTD